MSIYAEERCRGVVFSLYFIGEIFIGLSLDRYKQVWPITTSQFLCWTWGGARTFRLQLFKRQAAFAYQQRLQTIYRIRRLV